MRGSGTYLCECQSRARETQLKKDGMIDKSQIGKRVGFLRASLIRDYVCAERIDGTEKEFMTKTIDVAIEEERAVSCA